MWDHLPDADALLAARVAEGWRPRTSPMQDGDRVLGHAACLLTDPTWRARAEER